MGRCGAGAADQPSVRRRYFGPGHPGHRTGPGRGAERHGHRCARLALWLGLYAVLHHQLHLHRPCRDHRLPCQPVQHRGRRAGTAGRAWRGAGLPGPALAALDRGAAGGQPGCGAVRCGLGGDPCLSAGAARQPYRDHDDHVQLHRLGADCLHAGRCAAPRGPDGPGDSALPRRHQPAHAGPDSGLQPDLHQDGPRQCHLPGGAGRMRAGLGAALAHAPGL